jgi:putative inorganic carbon (HCO3(-)) transporter
MIGTVKYSNGRATLRMKAQSMATTAAPVKNWAPPKVGRSPAEARWDLAFAGLLLYVLVEYSRLPEMYPILAVLHLGKVAIFLAALGYLIHQNSFSVDRTDTRVFDIAIFLFLFADFVSSCFAPGTWDEFGNMVNWGIVYFLVTRILINSWRVRVFLFLVFLLNLKLAQHVVREYIAERGIGLSDMKIILGGGAGAGSAGYFGNAADLGVAMAVVWGIAFALVVGRTEKNKLPRYFLLICFAVFLLAILLCGSRGAVVGGAAIVLAALARTPKKLGSVVVTLVFLSSIWFILPGASKERFQSAWDWQNDANAASRVAFWKAGLHMFEDHPILGIGPGSFPQVYLYDYNGIGAYECHSIYVQVLAETGLAGTLVFLTLLFLLLRLNARTRKSAMASNPDGKRSFEYCLALGLDLGLVGFLASGAFVSVLYYPHLWILLALSVATNIAYVDKRPKTSYAAIRSERTFALVSS